MERGWDPGEPLADVSPGMWIQERLWSWGPGSSRQGVAVGCIVPEGFEAYARVLHPAYREGDLAPIRWSAVAARTGATAHPLMQFHRIAKIPLHEYPSWGMLPSEVSLPAIEARRLVSILGGFTSRPDRCYLGIWEGFGVPELQAWRHRPRLFLPHRAYFLFPGPIDAVAALSFGAFQHPANLWWPQTRTWCVATDIDLYETYIAGSEACIQRVVEDSDLEAFRVKLEDRVDIDGDLINR